MLMVVVVAVLVLTITSGAWHRHTFDHHDKTSGRSTNAAGSRSICLPYSSGGVSCTDAWKLADNIDR